MTKEQLAAFLELLMCCDPWPVASDANDTQRKMKDFANQESVRHGFADWIDAYHKT